MKLYSVVVFQVGEPGRNAFTILLTPDPVEAVETARTVEPNGFKFDEGPGVGVCVFGLEVGKLYSFDDYKLPPEPPLPDGHPILFCRHRVARTSRDWEESWLQPSFRELFESSQSTNAVKIWSEPIC